jgi:hypothetical protein
MTQKRSKTNDENEDPQMELGVEDGIVRKKTRRQGGNNASSRTTRSNSTGGGQVDYNEGDNDREREGNKDSSPTRSVLEVLGGPPSDKGDSDTSDDDDDDDDDDSVELHGNNAVPPSRRDNQIVGGGRGRQLGSRDVGPRNVVDNGGPPSRDSPFVGGRGGTQQLGNWNADNSGGRPPLRDYQFGSNRHGSQVGNRNVANNVVPDLRDNSFVGGGRGGRLGTGNGNMNPFPGMQVDGQQLGLGDTSTVGGNHRVRGLQERTDELQGHGVIEHHGMTSLQHGRRAMSYRTAKGLTKKNIRDRIQVTMKTVIFRGVKFITCNEYFDMVMQVILDQERPADTSQFVRMYKTTVVGALNTKRSTCEQAAQEAMMKLLKSKNHVDEVDPPPHIQLTCFADFASHKQWRKRRLSCGLRVNCWSACAGRGRGEQG